MPPISFSLKQAVSAPAVHGRAGSGPSIPRPPKRVAAFSGGDGDDDDDDGGFGNGDDGAAEDARTGMAPTPASAPAPVPVPARGAPAQRPMRRVDEAVSAAALAEDPGVYDYDAAHDRLSSARAVLREAAAEEKRERVPQYMSSFLEKAALRKRDRERAESKLLARQREAEGDAFKDTEAFVTDAYRDHLAQIEREEKEEEDEAQARAAQDTGDGTRFKHRHELLRAQEDRHAALQRAADSGLLVREQTETRVRPAENKKMEGVELNDDGEVVDERQLLSTGLNVLRAPKRASSPRTRAASASRTQEGASRSAVAQTHGRDRDARARQSRLVEQQMLELERARAQEEEEARRARHRAHEDVPPDRAHRIQAAKERALARKRQRLG